MIINKSRIIKIVILINFVIMSLTSFSLVKDFTCAGFGIGYLTREYIKKELDNKILFELNIKEKIPSRNIGVAYSKKVLSFSAKELINIIKKE